VILTLIMWLPLVQHDQHSQSGIEAKGNFHVVDCTVSMLIRKKLFLCGTATGTIQDIRVHLYIASLHNAS